MLLIGVTWATIPFGIVRMQVVVRLNVQRLQLRAAPASATHADHLYAELLVIQHLTCYISSQVSHLVIRQDRICCLNMMLLGCEILTSICHWLLSEHCIAR